MNLSLNTLLKCNQQFIKQYQTNPLMHLINGSQMHQASVRHQLLDAIQLFSNYFQKIVMLRYVFCDHPSFLQVCQKHLQEEFGHNFLLMQDRDNRPPMWDAILEAAASWFCWKMFTLDEEEKVVLVHMVMEASAQLFFQQAHKVMQYYGETTYFETHAHADEKHEKMGIELLEELKPQKYQRLLEVQKQGWIMLNTICERIAQLALSNDKKKLATVEKRLELHVV